tara:strand:+ start:2143 stop:2448 length:306 start_codon:yes stop_codon:yes gene_type:complete
MTLPETQYPHKIGKLSKDEHRRMYCYLVSVAQKYPATIAIPASLAATAGRIAKLWAIDSSDTDRQEVGKMAHTACTEYPEEVLKACAAVCIVLSTTVSDAL